MYAASENPRCRCFSIRTLSMTPEEDDTVVSHSGVQVFSVLTILSSHRNVLVTSTGAEWSRTVYRETLDPWSDRQVGLHRLVY